MYCVAKRTRKGRAVIEKENLERKKQMEKKNGGESASALGPRRWSEKGNGVLGSQKSGTNCRTRSFSVSVSHGDEEGRMQKVDEGAFAEQGSFGANNVGEPVMGFGQSEDFDSVEVGDSDGGSDVEIIGERDEGSIGSVEILALSSESDEASIMEDEDHEVITSGKIMDEASPIVYEAQMSNDAIDDVVCASFTEMEKFTSGEDQNNLDGMEKGGENSQEKEEKEEAAKRDVTKRGRRKRVEIVEVELKRRKYGLDIFVGADDEIDGVNNTRDDSVNVNQGCKYVAQRTRSRFVSKLGKRNTKLGTLSHPLCVDEEEQGVSCEPDHCDVGDEPEKEQEVSSGPDDCDEPIHSGRKRKSIKKKSGSCNGGGTRRFGEKKSHTHKRDDNACVEEVQGKLELRKLTKKKLIPQIAETSIPSTFPFEIEEPTVAEISESDKRLNPLWTDLYSGLRSTENDTAHTAKVGNGYNQSTEHEADTDNHCCQGDHHLIHDEEIITGCKLGEGKSITHKRNDNAYMKKVQGKQDLGNSKKKECIRAPTNCVNQFLLNSISLTDQMPLEELVCEDGEKNPPVTETAIPSTFPFEIEESAPSGKSDSESELDPLWAELHNGLRSCETDSVHTAKVGNGYDQSRKRKGDIGTRYCQGDHHLILDEEIGILCKYCSYVKWETEYISPPFYKNPCGKSDWREPCTADKSIFRELQHHSSGCDAHSGMYTHAYTEGSVWDIIPGVKNNMFSHQCEAFEFIWSHIAGGIHLDELKKQTTLAGGSGCIISHAPGTGKTRLTIGFLQTYMKLYPTCKPIIIAPTNMLLTWEEEFNKWKVDIPFHNLNKDELSHKENEKVVSLLRQHKHLKHDVSIIRNAKLYSWKKDKSILGISYQLFKQLAGEDTYNTDVSRALLELPDILVLDEGHNPRNDQTCIWQALSKIQTKRRIILSGTPFQNNFDELYNTLRLANPNFASMITSRCHWDLYRKNVWTKNETKRKWASLTNLIGKVHDDVQKRYIVTQIKDLIHPFVHVHRGDVLKESLPGLKDLVVILKPTQLQNELLEDIKEERKTIGGSHSLKLEYRESLTSVHPSLLPVPKLEDELEKLRLNPEVGVKTKFLMELVRLSEVRNEKVLVFSQFIDPLILIKNMLESHFSWTEGKEVLQMDGSISSKLRQTLMKSFNDLKSETRVLLASTKACSEGISLIGASRVVLLDVVWNPSVERQAISRAYRIGQTKVVYVYHLITSGTRDEIKYKCQAEKDQFSELVFFCSDMAGHRRPNISSADLEDKILEVMVQHKNHKNMFEKIDLRKESGLI
ncbi:SNF2 domain-containing protein CLASSY 4-like [Quillaja saponaria]|uniref:SNF2 domain-containing protein CLASSY 4-like n=1 Tax=Quillaja saponaria TaxID=32244 RepID=A0AAD7L6Q1_QUISA|nr:SNF2 domain-containing protein CLASSY 4-like [Quillaja saponaria]